MKIRERGFTLIELLVVIAIIGVLSGIVLVSLGGVRASARDASRQANIHSINQALELYYNTNTAFIVSATMPTAIGTFLPTVPLDPGSGTPAYGWVCNKKDAAIASCPADDANQDYCVYATLETTKGGAGNKVLFVGDPGGTRERTVAAAFVPTLANCY